MKIKIMLCLIIIGCGLRAMDNAGSRSNIASSNRNAPANFKELCEACASGDYDKVNAFLNQYKLYLNEHDNDGLTPLGHAMTNGHWNIVVLLQTHGTVMDTPFVYDNQGKRETILPGRFIKKYKQDAPESIRLTIPNLSSMPDFSYDENESDKYMENRREQELKDEALARSLSDQDVKLVVKQDNQDEIPRREQEIQDEEVARQLALEDVAQANIRRPENMLEKRNLRINFFSKLEKQLMAHCWLIGSSLFVVATGLAYIYYNKEKKPKQKA